MHEADFIIFFAIKFGGKGYFLFLTQFAERTERLLNIPIIPCGT